MTDPTPTTLDDWCRHCGRQADTWRTVADRARETASDRHAELAAEADGHAGTWEALLSLAAAAEVHSTRHPGDQAELLAAVATLAARLEPVTRCPLPACSRRWPADAGCPTWPGELPDHACAMPAAHPDPCWCLCGTREETR